MWRRCFDSNKAVFGADSWDDRNLRLYWRQDYTQNLDYGLWGLQHRNILLKVLNQANPHYLISNWNVALCNKNTKSKLQEGVIELLHGNPFNAYALGKSGLLMNRRGWLFQKVKPQNRLTQRGKWKKYYLPPLNSLILQIQNLLGGVGGDPLKVLQETSGNKRKASEILGIDRTTLYKILQKEDV